VDLRAKFVRVHRQKVCSGLGSPRRHDCEVGRDSIPMRRQREAFSADTRPHYCWAWLLALAWDAATLVSLYGCRCWRCAAGLRLRGTLADVMFAISWLWPPAIVFAAAERDAPLRVTASAGARIVRIQVVLLRPNAVIAAPFPSARTSRRAE